MEKYKEFFKQVLVSSTLTTRGVVYIYFLQDVYSPTHFVVYYNFIRESSGYSTTRQTVATLKVFLKFFKSLFLRFP